jgi:hypothetical protein
MIGVTQRGFLGEHPIISLVVGESYERAREE